MPKKFDDWRKGIERSLRKKYPNWSEKQIESSAYAIAVKNWQKKYGKSP